MVIFLNIFSICQGKGLAAEEYTKLKTLRTNLFRWVGTVRKNIILDFDLIGAPAKKKPKLSTPTLEEKLEESSKNKADKANKESSLLAIDTSKPATSSAAATNVEEDDEYEDEIGDVIATSNKKRSKLHDDIVKIYPNVLTTGVFIYNDVNNNIVVVCDNEINAEFLNLVTSSSSSSKD